MRGVKCSWKEMQRLHRDVLPALEAGDGKKYSELRCVTPAAISQWRNASRVMQVLDDSELTYVNFETFQPTHAREIARHFRKRDKSKDWSAETKAEIVALVERCEDQQLTVKQLRALLHNGEPKDKAAECWARLQAEERAADARIVTDLADLAGEKFGTIYADPPWRYGNQGTRGSTDKHYETMTVDEICALPIGDLAADDAHLHLWTTNGFLPDSFRVLEAWGFTYQSCFVWVKTQMGMGNAWRVSHEFLLFGQRGDVDFADKGLRSWAEFPRTKHSAKPEAVRGMVEKASPGPRLELFGRERIHDWTVYGNQISKQKRLPG